MKRTFGLRGEKQQEAGENEHHDVSFLPSVGRMIKSRRMRGVGHVACMGGNKNLYSDVVKKPERKMLLVRITCMWYDIIEMDILCKC